MVDNKKLIKTLESQLDKIADKKTKDWYKGEHINKLPLTEQLDLALSFFAEKYAEDKIVGILFLQNYLYNKFKWKLLVTKFEKLFVQSSHLRI